MWQRHTFRTDDVVRDPETREEYRILDIIGVGAYAEVFKAECVRTGGQYAIKVLNIRRAAEAKARERHRREGQLLMRVKDPNLVQVHALIEDGDKGVVALVMDLLVGRTLAQLRADCGGKLPINTALELMAEVCNALDTIHGQGVVHRDVKPENVFVVDDGHARLCDLGVSQFPHERRITTDGVAIGTVAYMSPEQLYSPELVGPRSDLFAVGAILYEAIAGVNAFAVDGQLPQNLKELGMRIILQPHTPLKDVAPHVPDYIAAIVESLLAKEPASRPRSASNLLVTLTATRQRYLDELAERNETPLRISFVRRLPPAPRVATQEMPLTVGPPSPNPFISISVPPEPTAAPPPEPAAAPPVAFAKTDSMPVVRAQLAADDREASLPPAAADPPSELDAAARASLELANRQTTPWQHRAPALHQARLEATSTPAVTLPIRSTSTDPRDDVSLTTEAGAALEIVAAQGESAAESMPLAGRSPARPRDTRRSRWLAPAIVALVAGVALMAGRAAHVFERLGSTDAAPQPSATTVETPRPPSTSTAPTASVMTMPTASPSASVPTASPSVSVSATSPPPRTPDPGPGRRQPAGDAPAAGATSRPRVPAETAVSMPVPSQAAQPAVAPTAAPHRLFGAEQ